MHHFKPYKVCELLKLPLGIESINAVDDHLFVGTKEGHLLMYSVALDNLNHDENQENSETNASAKDNAVHVQLLRSNKNFKKKAILKLEAVPEFSILVTLSDSVISVHDIDLKVTNFPVITSLSRTKGASTFALDVQRIPTLTGEIHCVVRLVVAVRKTLQLYLWKNRKFIEFGHDINLHDVPRSLAWRDNSLCIGYRSEYCLIKLSTLDKVELFPTGKSQENTSVTLMSDDRFALGKDDQTKFVDLTGSLALDSITWSETPFQVGHDPPYLVASLSNSIEIRTESPKMTIQSVQLAKPLIIAVIEKRPGLVFVASSSLIWCLKMMPVSKQISQLMHEKQFDLALTLTKVCSDRAHQVQQIQILKAFDLFVNLKFKEAMDLFLLLNVDASHVIGLYSHLLPSDFRSQLKYPEKLPVLSGKDLEDGYEALKEYLTQVRHGLDGSSVKNLSPVPMSEGSVVVKSKKQLMQIIDTTLLKCYLKINDSLVASLLRLPTNCCHQDETERALKKSQKYSELIIFYNTRGLHQKALALLQEQSDLEDSPLYGVAKTVQYLQNLGPEHINLVFEYATRVLEKSPSEGLSIFTDILDVDSWPRAAIYDFLLKNCKDMVIPYLEHIIHQWKEPSTLFHNAIIIQYKELLVDLFELAESQEAQDKIRETRQKLRKVLDTSLHYNAEIILPKFPLHCLYEERARLLGSIGKHKEALTLYLFQVHNVAEAFDYCDKQYAKNEKQVYTIFYQLLVSPPDALSLKAMYVSHANAHAKTAPDMSVALKLLEQHAAKVDLNVVLTHTPSNVPLSLLTPYLETTLGAKVSQRHQMQLLRGLMHAEHLQVQEQRIDLESQKVAIDETDVCPVCSKRFRGQTAIVRFPNNRVVHYGCQERAIVPNL